MLVKVDQEKSRPVYNLETALSRPVYPEISAVTLVGKVSLQYGASSNVQHKGGVQR